MRVSWRGSFGYLGHALVAVGAALADVDDEFLVDADDVAPQPVPIFEVAQADAELLRYGSGHVAGPDGVDELDGVGRDVAAIGGFGDGHYLVVGEIFEAVEGVDRIFVFGKVDALVDGQAERVAAVGSCGHHVAAVLRVELAQRFDWNLDGGRHLLEVERAADHDGVAGGGQKIY